MTHPDTLQKQESLDPQDWDAMRELGHRMMSDMLDHMQNIREEKIWQPIPTEIRDYFQQPAPQDSTDENVVYDEFLEKIMPYPLGNTHPRFWGWIVGTGTPMGALADFLVSVLNPSLGGGEQIGYIVENQVINWCKEMLNYPMTSSGVLVSGGSIANLTGLIVARNEKSGIDFRKEGVYGIAQQRMMLYMCAEGHSSIQKGLEIMGMGSNSLHKIPCNADYQMDIDLLRQAIAEDKAKGYKPFCIVGNAGTVNTGSFDDFNALADICEAEDMWFHVDGAFGAMVSLSPKYKYLTDGMNRADSLAFDLHKWLSMPIEIGCTLVKDADAHYNAFTLTPSYLNHGSRGASAGETWFSDYGIQLTRNFRALKAWMSFRNYGLQKYGRIIEQNMDQVHYLADLVQADPELEMPVPVYSNVICFRYIVPGWSQEQLNQLNQNIMYELHERAIAVPTHAILKDGTYVLRLGHVNHRTTNEDFEVLVDTVKSIGRELAQHPHIHAEF